MKSSAAYEGGGSLLPESSIDQAKARIVEVIESYGVKLEKKGTEFVALCPFHDEKTPSFTVTPDSEKYYCFGCGANGDAIDFVTAHHSDLSFPAAVRRIMGEVTPTATTGAPRRQSSKREEAPEWVPVTPAPADAPRPMNVFNRRRGDSWERLVSSRAWPYHDATGALIGYTCRFELPGGGKDVMPQSWCRNTRTGATAWRWLSFAKPRPLYGLDKLAAHPGAQVLLVEGEKAADAAQAYFEAAGIARDKLITVSWPGGGKAVKHTDWSPLTGRSVGLWPDADQKAHIASHPRAGELMPLLEQPGTLCMLDLAERITATAKSVKIVVPPAGVADGWDLADEFPKGFDPLAHLKAHALPVADFIERLQPQTQDDTPPWEEPTEPPHGQEPEPPTPPEEDEAPDDGGFSILGYDRGAYFFFQHEGKQLRTYRKSDFTDVGLMELAPLNWWELNFPAAKGGLDRKAAVNWIIRTALTRGIYDPTMVRGRGAWRDDGRAVFHFGSMLHVDGKPTDVTKIRSRYTYEMARSLPNPDIAPLTAEEGKRLLDIARMFRWTKEASGPLLAGFTALAPLCGAIPWRPHLWLTGAAGSGKTKIQSDYVHALLGGIDIYAQGNSTEAGIRQTLGCDALPVLIDESESNEESDRKRLQSILALIRQSSTETAAQQLKGSPGGDAQHFHIRSMFCLASIQIGMKYQADFERLTVLALRPKREDGSLAEKQQNAENWERIKEALYGLRRDETLPARLFRRSLDLLPITLKNIDTFAAAAALKFGSQRDGDQYGTLMAGAWSLISDQEATQDQATKLLDRYDWGEYLENADTEESVKALGALLEAQMRLSGGIVVNVFEVIRRAYGEHVPGLEIDAGLADSVLQRHGMKIRGERLLLSNNSQELRRLVAGTPYESDLRGQLLRVRGADRYDNRSQKFNGIDSKCISLPLAIILADEDDPNPEIPF